MESGDSRFIAHGEGSLARVADYLGAVRMLRVPAEVVAGSRAGRSCCAEEDQGGSHRSAAALATSSSRPEVAYPADSERSDAAGGSAGGALRRARCSGGAAVAAAASAREGPEAGRKEPAGVHSRECGHADRGASKQSAAVASALEAAGRHARARTSSTGNASRRGRGGGAQSRGPWREWLL